MTVEAETTVSQPLLVRQVGPEIGTRVINNSRLRVEEAGGATFVPPGPTTVADLVKGCPRPKTSTTTDAMSILQGIQAAGALHADLIVQ